MNILPSLIQIVVALCLLALIIVFDGALNESSIYVFIALVAILMGYFIYRDWDIIKNGRLEVSALTNYKGKYSPNKASELIVIVKNPHWKKADLQQIQFFDSEFKLIDSVDQDQSLEYGGSIGFDLGDLSKMLEEDITIPKYVKVLTAKGRAYEAKITPACWYHI